MPEGLVKNGWAVAGVDMEETGIEGVRGVRADVSEEDQVRRAVAETAEHFGRLDALVSNAGVSEFGGPDECSLTDWNRILATNLTASYLFAREVGELRWHASGQSRKNHATNNPISPREGGMSEHRLVGFTDARRIRDCEKISKHLHTWSFSHRPGCNKNDPQRIAGSLHEFDPSPILSKV